MVQYSDRKYKQNKVIKEINKDAPYLYSGNFKNHITQLKNKII